MKRSRQTPAKGIKKVCGSESEKTSSRGSTSTGSSENKETLQVFCRVRPLEKSSDRSCVTVIPPNIIKVSALDANRDGNYRETQYMFRNVFDQHTSQSTVFAETSFDLVKQLLKGKNGLLFAYGITGSGKTFTMNGVAQNLGILPRCVDVIFNSINEYQTKKFFFKPDRLNGFEVQSEPDAMLDRQRELMSNSKTPSKLWKKESEDLFTKQSCTLTAEVNKENLYSVFVNYVEIYNNAVYDLIEDIPDDVLRQRPLQSKFVREDGSRNMYVHSVTEVEVKSALETFEVYLKGQKRRRLAATSLNTESSRSHSVFTIRVVQAPSNSNSDSLQKDRNQLKISQLSLVDLAGSERSSRTKAAGQRLKEAGCINNSLLTLRTCLEILRENHTQGTSKMVPYRESRVTHLFKKYFDGEGDIRMIICINPCSDDYEETLHVLKFAEMSQEVLVNRAPPQPPKPESQPLSAIYATPSHRRNNRNLKQITSKPEVTPRPSPYDRCGDKLNLAKFSMPHFPDSTDHSCNSQLISIIQIRIQKSNELNEMMEKIANRMSSKFHNKEAEYGSVTNELKLVTGLLNNERGKNTELESRLIKTNLKNSELQGKLVSSENNVKSLEYKVADMELRLNKEQLEVLRERNRYKSKLAQSKEKFSKQMEDNLLRQKSALELEIVERDRKMQRVKKALDTPMSCTALIRGTPSQIKPSTPSVRSVKTHSDPSVPSNENIRPISTPRSYVSTVSSTFQTPTVGRLDVATPRTCHESRSCHKQPLPVSSRRRSRSVGSGSDHWLDHRPLTATPLNTVLQPFMKRRKSVTELTDSKDIANSKTSKYCLTTQELDSDGDIETCLYKGDVVPTTGGGAQVVFNGVEILHHKSPPSSPSKTNCRSPRNCAVARDIVKDRCALSIEGHSNI